MKGKCSRIFFLEFYLSINYNLPLVLTLFFSPLKSISLRRAKKWLLIQGKKFIMELKRFAFKKKFTFHGVKNTLSHKNSIKLARLPFRRNKTFLPLAFHSQILLNKKKNLHCIPMNRATQYEKKRSDII